MDPNPTLRDIAGNIHADPQQHPIPIDPQLQQHATPIIGDLPIQTKIPPILINTGLPDPIFKPEPRPSQREDASGARILAVLALLSAAGFLLAILVQGLLR